jgi:hypothetical protein
MRMRPRWLAPGGVCTEPARPRALP